jgi:hypothetical protein
MATKDQLLTCRHCGVQFDGTPSQRKHYPGRSACCSDACRLARDQVRLAKIRKPQSGPCETCGQMFHSAGSRERRFCTLRCYIASPQFQRMSAANLGVVAERFESMSPDERRALYAHQKKGEDVPCAECGRKFYRKRDRSHRIVCSMPCWRAYMAKRFDRWMANPQGLALPQGYDEFLNQIDLPCLVDGCNWRGQWLTVHANQVHGLRAAEFKRAAGFNLKTGVVTTDLSRRLGERVGVGVAVADLYRIDRQVKAMHAAIKAHTYKSLEGVEHQRKARALRAMEPGPTRICGGCLEAFEQTTPYGRAKYCSISCRDDAYRRNKWKAPR